MSQPWKLLPLAAVLAVIGALLLAPGGVVQPDQASAAINCNSKGILEIKIRDLDNSGNAVAKAGITVRISPDPQDNAGTRDYVDNGTNDDSNTIGTIRESEACSATAEDYTVLITTFPTGFDCDVLLGGSDTFAVTAGQLNTVELYVSNCETAATATPTGTITATPGAAATVTTSASPASISCSGTSIVTIQVRDASGSPVPPATAVTITTTIGSVNPSSGQTTDASGNAFVFLTAPANQGGVATVTAKAGNAQGSTNVTINCGTASPTATTAPPPTVGTGGGAVISPPNTGDAGLAAATTGTSWVTLAGVSLLVAATALGAVGIVKVRA